MKTIYFFLSGLFLCAAASANTKDSLVNHSSKKNEIGMILNPVGIILLGAEPIGKRIGFLYKRKSQTPNVYFTSGLYYQGFRNTRNKWNELTLEVNGLLRNVQYNEESAQNAMFSFGAEQRWTVSQCPAIVTYLGFEFILSYGIENSNIGNQWMRADTLQGAELNYQNMQAVSDFNQTKKVTKTSIGGGCQFNAGIQLHLNKRLYLFAQTAPTMLFTSGTRVEENLVTKTNTKYKTSQFEFDMRALISDIGMAYRF